MRHDGRLFLVRANAVGRGLQGCTELAASLDGWHGHYSIDHER